MMEILLKARIIYPPWNMEKRWVSIAAVNLPRAGRIDFAAELAPQLIREVRVPVRADQIAWYLDSYGAEVEVRADECLGTFLLSDDTVVYRIRIGGEILDVPESEFPVPLILPIG